MRRLVRGFLPTSRLTLALWAWRNRYMALDWLAFALRAIGDAAAGKGTSDARAELRLRGALARDPATRGVPIDVRVENGVCTLRGRVTPELHARIQDKTVVIPAIKRINDRLVNMPIRGRRLRLRSA